MDGTVDNPHSFTDRATESPLLGMKTNPDEKVPRCDPER